MKYILVIVSVFSSTLAFCQTKPTNHSSKDSVQIVYGSSKKLKAANQPSYYVEGKLWNTNALSLMDPGDIKSIAVKNSSKNGEIWITLKDPGKMASLSLLSKEIERHLGPANTPTIYMIDDKFITDDLNTYKIEKNYILRLEVMTADDIASLKQSGLKLRVINVVTRSQKNIDKAKQVYIRGGLASTD